MLRKYDTRVYLTFLIIFGLVSLALFFGLFFGLNYPEIKQHENPTSTCTVTWAQHDQKYVCKKDCSACTDAINTNISCDSLVNTGNLYSPMFCQQNYSMCPPIGSTCNDGYKCCTQCKTNCCKFTTKLQCSLSCLVFSKITIGVSFVAVNVTVNSQIETDFNNDLSAMNTFNVQYATGSQFVCQYDPSNNTNVIIDPEYTKWKWIVTSIASACVAICIALFALFLVRFIQRKLGYHQ